MLGKMAIPGARGSRKAHSMTRNGTASVLVVDDYEDWRSQVRILLQTRSEWTIISEAGDGLEAVRQAAELQPDIILLDLSLPTLNGIDASKIIRERCPKSRVIFLTENSDCEIREAALGTGASAYVLKTNAAHELLGVIAAAMREPYPAVSAAEPR
jgi:DNA-binding NarL/FixJ family response regulator